MYMCVCLFSIIVMNIKYAIELPNERDFFSYQHSFQQRFML